jgi:[ribosomal protein S5]-alanine N-acetyltransferase
VNGRGDQILLRLLRVEDAQAALDYAIENREFLAEWEPVRAQGWFTIEAQVADIEAAIADEAADRRYSFGVFRDDQLVGRITLNQVVRGVFQNAYLGYSIGKRWNGRGFASEAVRLALGYAFGEVGLHRVQAAVMPRNAGSIRVLEKNGFREEGYAVGYLCINGVWEDHRVFARTSDQAAR